MTIRSSRLLLAAALIASGYVLGSVMPFTTRAAATTGTVVYSCRQTVRLKGGTTLPKGTKLFEDTYMSEGFYRLKLFVNVDPVVLEKQFEKKIDPRDFLVVPYWVRE